MSILIKGVEMPTAEQGVRTINIYADGVVTNYAEVTIAQAVPVPPHGRLIDADALMLRVNIHGTNKFGMLDEDIRQFIGDAPTIIPADKEAT